MDNETLQQETFQHSFFMVESEVFFEPYRLVMKALREFNEDCFPMKQFLVYGNTAVQLPQYAKTLNKFYVYDFKVDLMNDDSWPNHSLIDLDEHQFKALKTALTSNFSVIQGPPGTGKTYLGLKIIEVLLKNLHVNRNAFRAPILLVCYTNHALDQFLEGILKYTDRIIRVGRQSDSEILDKYNLRNQEIDTPPKLIRSKRDCSDKIETITFDLMKMNEVKNNIEKYDGILSYNTLSNVMNSEFKKKIMNNEMLLDWLLPADNNNDTSIVQNHPQNFTKIIDVSSPTERMETGEHDNQNYETMDAYEDDGSVGYCVSIKSLENSLSEARSASSYLYNERHRIFNDDNKYRDAMNLKRGEIKIIEHRLKILKRYLRESESKSSNENNPSGISLSKIPLKERWNIYKSWVSHFKSNLVNEMKNLEVLNNDMIQELEEIKQEVNLHIVKKSAPAVIGMTTTCAARLQLLLKMLKPAIVIVEEAAEVLEAHVLVSLTKDCEQVILIGDHKQLQPSAAVYELSKQYNINVSLFERMINNNMYCPQLQIQHRMRPEISSLIVPSIYPNLKNHESVLEYPSVKGITKNLFFVDHNVFEEQVENSSSKKNQFEADFVIELCRYLLLQGYAADKVTILTTYAGQMLLLGEMKRKIDIMKNVKVHVVDKYQGEQNDIILLSLVRSNEDRKIGFLSIENRVCVALSRAKIGLYIIGNMDILSDSAIWKNIKEELVRQEAIGPKLTLRCDKHGICTKVSCKKDFDQVPKGGCYKKCHEMMDCGHYCRRPCHRVQIGHMEKCRERCLRRCNRKHPCKKYCFEECGQCRVPTTLILTCQHKVTVPCFEADTEIECGEPCRKKCAECKASCQKKCYEDCKPCKNNVIKRVPDCGHEIKVECSVVVERKLCQKKCHRIAPCGHKCMSACGIPCGSECKEVVDSTCVQAVCGHGYVSVPCCKKNEAIDTEKFLLSCTEPCATILKCGHICPGNCSSCWQGRLHETCDKKCENMLICGHSCSSACQIVCPPCTKKCNYKCKHNTCSNDCGVPCTHCKEKCEWKCKHKQCTRKCGDICDREPCYESCTKKLKCGHECIGFCGEPCPTSCRICDKDEVNTNLHGNKNLEVARFVLLEDCGHYIESDALDQLMSLSAENNEIRMKMCPVCQTPISTTSRFMNRVKKFYFGIQNVRKKWNGDDEYLTEIHENLIRKLKSLDSIKSHPLLQEGLQRIPKTVTVFMKHLQIQGKKCRIWTLKTMKYFVEMFSSITSRLKDLSQCTEREQSRILEKLSYILHRVNPATLCLSVQRVFDIHQELNRYHRMVDYSVHLNNSEYSRNRYSSNVIAINDEIVDILYGIKRYDDEQDAKIEKLLEKLPKGMKIVQPLSKEKRTIHTVMKKEFLNGMNKQGCWFMCTNGHHYCITESDRALEESKCPDCVELLDRRDRK